MRSNYKPIGNYIKQVSTRNRDGAIASPMGIKINKVFMPSVANTIGTDLSKYRVVSKNQFAYNPMHVGRDGVLPIALLEKDEPIIVSPAYVIFEIIDETVLDPEYLMMWCRRSEFDREAWFTTDSSVRGGFSWNALCEMEMPVPSITKQREIVKEYNTIVNRISLNETLNQKLEETAQALYKHWFVDFEFPNEEGKPYKSSGGEMVYNAEVEQDIPKKWNSKKLKEISELKYGKMLDSNKFLESGYPVFSGYGLRGFYSSFMYESPQILVLCRGVSGTGRVVMSPEKAYITNLSIVVELSVTNFNQQFLFQYLKNQNLRALDSGSAQSQITTGDLNEVDIMIPPEQVQSIFGNYMLDIKNNIDKNKKYNGRLLELESILLSRMSVSKFMISEEKI